MGTSAIKGYPEFLLLLFSFLHDGIPVYYRLFTLRFQNGSLCLMFARDVATFNEPSRHKDRKNTVEETICCVEYLFLLTRKVGWSPLGGAGL